MQPTKIVGKTFLESAAVFNVTLLGTRGLGAFYPVYDIIGRNSMVFPASVFFEAIAGDTCLDPLG